MSVAVLVECVLGAFKGMTAIATDAEETAWAETVLDGLAGSALGVFCALRTLSSA